jgi:hypothetical protein
VFTLIAFARVPFCPLAGVLGVPCPGCGLTRATLALLRGNVRQALHLHPLVFVLMPIFVWTLSAAALSYVRGPRAHVKPNRCFTSRSAAVLASTLLVATLGVWGVRFLGYLGGPVPVQTFGDWVRARR